MRWLNFENNVTYKIWLSTLVYCIVDKKLAIFCSLSFVFKKNVPYVGVHSSFNNLTLFRLHRLIGGGHCTRRDIISIIRKHTQQQQ
jgi:hypothetical protein